ncbi:MAG: alpha-L-fucosidase [Acidobacteriaceae bacterium]|nr:alpha-L-fucosidase [Acidobacteriaceae bacterium]
MSFNLDVTRRSFLSSGAAGIGLALRSSRVSPSTSYEPLPSERQVRWSEMEYYNFLHFTVNTFTDKEWGYGSEDPAIFNPTQFDADAIVEALKASGSKGVILTCKHHDGFCLWPTSTTSHSIRNSPYKAGKGDIVKEISRAAGRHGLKFGVYVSPWDRSQASYGTPQYLQIYRKQVEELLTGYGPVFEIWHDGANGGTGYYGGANEKRIIDKRHYYDWPATWALERKLQPDAVIFSDVGPDVRWVGNEKGIAGETCWATYTPLSPDGGPGSPGDVQEKQSIVGTRNGEYWMPAECDVSIRPGWFWHERENNQVKSPRDLLDLYYDSVGRGASFLLNVPPDRRGLISDNDRAALRGFRALIDQIFSHDLAIDATVNATNVRGRSPEFSPKTLLDGDRYSYWSTDDPITQADVTFDLPRPTQFDIVRIRENIRLGQRVDSFMVEVWTEGNWSRFGEGTSIGSCRIVGAQAPVTTTRVRLRITKAAVCPALSEFGLFSERV